MILRHILPAKEILKSTNTDDDEFKSKRKEKQKQDSKKESNWNTLFMSSDAVAESMANRMDISKGELLDRDADNMAVRLALAETHIIQETVQYLEEEGVCIDVFKNKNTERSDTVILVKNIPFSTTEEDLRRLFQKHGDLVRVIYYLMTRWSFLQLEPWH